MLLKWRKKQSWGNLIWPTSLSKVNTNTIYTINWSGREIVNLHLRLKGSYGALPTVFCLACWHELSSFVSHVGTKIYSVITESWR